MTEHKQPSKESVRQWLRAELAQRRPPPTPSQIRHALDWHLARPANPKA